LKLEWGGKRGRLRFEREGLAGEKKKPFTVLLRAREESCGGRLGKRGGGGKRGY